MHFLMSLAYMYVNHSVINHFIGRLLKSSFCNDVSSVCLSSSVTHVLWLYGRFHRKTYYTINEPGVTGLRMQNFSDPEQGKHFQI